LESKITEVEIGDRDLDDVSINNKTNLVYVAGFTEIYVIDGNVDEVISRIPMNFPDVFDMNSNTGKIC
jgi:hypothetical protein